MAFCPTPIRGHFNCPHMGASYLLQMPDDLSLHRPVLMATSNLTIGELEAKYPLYCKALKLLLRQGKTKAQLQRTLCWDRLRLLNHSLPRNYKSPERLMQLIQAEFSQRQN